MKNKIIGYLFALRDGVVDFFKYDTGFKMLSLAIAVGLWLFLGAQNPETTRTYRNVTIDVNANMSGERTLSIIGDDTLEATVTATGKREALLDVVASDFDLTADATNIKEPGVYNLKIEAVSKIADVEVEKVSPTSIEVHLDYIITRELPIEVKVDNKLSEDEYEVTPYVKSAETVTVTGPETELSKVDKVYAVLKVEKAGKYNEKLNIRYADENGETVDSQYFKADINTVGVRLDAYVKKELPVRAYVDAEGSMTEENNYRLSVFPATITVYGSEGDLEDLEEISAGTFRAEELTDGSFEHILELPEGVQTKDSLEVNVSVRFTGIADKTFTVTDVRFKNAEPTVTARLNEGAAVTVRSSQELAEQDVYLEVDLENVFPGTQVLPATLGFNNGKQGELIGDATVNVTVEIDGNN